MAKKNGGERTFRTIEVAEELPAWDSKEGNCTIEGHIERSAIAETTYDGSIRPRNLVTIVLGAPAIGAFKEEVKEYAEGERINAWLPPMYYDETRKATGKYVRIVRSGKGRSDTRFTFQVAT